MTQKNPFSNFTKSSFTVDGIEFICGEQWIMYSKAKLFNDHEICNQILSSTKPAEIKKLGRQVKNYDEETWKTNRLPLAERGLLEKFKQDDSALTALLNSGDDIIVEASPTDKIWGVGLKVNDPPNY